VIEINGPMYPDRVSPNSIQRFQAYWAFQEAFPIPRTEPDKLREVTDLSIRHMDALLGILHQQEDLIQKGEQWFQDLRKHQRACRIFSNPMAGIQVYVSRDGTKFVFSSKNTEPRKWVSAPKLSMNNSKIKKHSKKRRDSPNGGCPVQPTSPL
jgi:hypothetical protein